MKKSFKVLKSYNPDVWIPISKAELPKAYYAFIYDKKFISEAGVPVNKVLDIDVDWHTVMGWHRERIIDGRDRREIGSDRMEKSEALMSAASKIGRAAGETKNLMERRQLLNQAVAIETTGHFVLPEKNKLLDAINPKK